MTNPSTPDKLRIGTRGSPLALAQAGEVQRRLTAAHGLAPDACEIVVIRTSGDRIQDRPLAEAGGKGLFTKEIEEALAGGRIDLAVHSMKDMPTALPDGLGITAILEREDVRDAFMSARWSGIGALPRGAVVGTSSLRRTAQVKRLRPDVSVVQFRGNVETRLRKLAEGAAEATFLAMAGLNRLGMADKVTAAVPVDVMLPAVAQGAVGVEVRLADGRTRSLVDALSHEASAAAVAIERAFLARLEGSCRTPIAGLAEIAGSGVRFRGELLSPDGRSHWAAERRGVLSDGIRMAEDAADELLTSAGPGFLTGRA